MLDLENSVNAPSATEAYEAQLLNWLKIKFQDGEYILKGEKAYTDTQRCIDFVEGEQKSQKSSSLSQITNNRLKKIVQETVSGLTDVRPIWNYETANEEFKSQATILNKLARAWWKSNLVDRKLASALTYSAVGGSGYVAITWDPELPGGGDLRPIPFDPRDVIPIDPVYTETIQDWGGIILRQSLPVEAVKKMYPSKMHKLVGGSEINSWGSTNERRGRMLDVVSSAWGVIKKGLGAPMDRSRSNVDLMRAFIKDDSLNTGEDPRFMTTSIEGTGYWVPALGSTDPKTGKKVTKEQARLYPRGRMIIFTPNAILDDGPNPYWHGMFPVVRFQLEPFPWLLLGTNMVADLLPLQEALNETIRGAADGIAQWIRRGVIADKTSVPQAMLSKIDTRKPGFHASVNSSMGDGFKIVDGPNLPNWYMQMVQYFMEAMDDNSGVKGMRGFQQIKDSPGMENVEKYMEMLSPLLRIRARSVELSLFEMAEMIKVGFFQFYTSKRRLEMLGNDGVGLEDFDYDPNTLVPSKTEGASREERTRNHHRNFTFTVAPNSFLNVSHTTQKLLILQLFRANGIDIWSMWDAMDLQQIGPMPAETIPERLIEARKMGLQLGDTPELVEAKQASMMATAKAQEAQALQAIQGMRQQAQMAQAGPKVTPGTAANNGVGPQGGRPPSGKRPPQIVMRDQGTRPIVSESGT